MTDWRSDTTAGKQRYAYQLARELIAGATDTGYRDWQSRYQSDPAAFARECVHWPTDQALALYQADVMGQLVEARRLAVRSPHGAGKTTTAALLALWYALTRDGHTDWKVVTTASAWRHLSRYLWPEVRKGARRLRWDAIGRPPLVDGRELLMMALQLETGSAFAVASDQPWAIEGAHAASLLYIFDEAKTIPEDTWDAAEGAFAGAGDAEALALAISTPGDTAGRFYDIHRRASGYADWSVRHVTLAEAVAAGRISQEWDDARAAQWGVGSGVYQNRVLGEFAAADESSVIPLAWVEAAVERWLALRDGGELETGELTCVSLDVADGGEDRSMMADRRGVVISALVDVTQPEPGMTMELAGLVVARTRGGGTAVVDSIGVGAGVVSRLREQGVRVMAFNAAEGTDRLDASGEFGFRNRRSAAWWGLRERLHPESGDGIALPDDARLIGDLTAPRWSVTSSGKIAVEGKDDIGRRLKRSTDSGDAVVMAFWDEPGQGSVPMGTPLGGVSVRGPRRDRVGHVGRGRERR